jgi:transposase
MPVTQYIVDLTEEERAQLLQLIRKGNSAARKLARARILLKAAEGLSDAQIAKVLDLGTATVGRVRKRFVEEGLDNALSSMASSRPTS